ncbi:MAG TPA: hypothetical protein VID68_06755 [Solirubrobacteraceae bacterium]
MALPALADVDGGVAAPRCEYCGEEIGPHAALWEELDGGAVTLSSTTELGEGRTGRMWHRGCLGRANIHFLS